MAVGMWIEVYSLDLRTGERTVLKKRTFTPSETGGPAPAYQALRPCACPRCREKPPGERVR